MLEVGTALSDFEAEVEVDILEWARANGFDRQYYMEELIELFWQEKAGIPTGMPSLCN